MDESSAPNSAAKQCSTCAEIKPLDAFEKADWCRDGHRGQCRKCRHAPPLREPAAERECTGCRLVKPTSEFQKRRQSYDGINRRCKACRKIEKAAEYQRNREVQLARNKAYYAANREEYLAMVARYQAANPDKRREYEGRRRARKAAATIGPIDLDALWTGNCGICLDPIDQDAVAPHPLSRSLDHIKPLVLGGSHEQSNLQWAHLRCNIRKGDRLTA